MITLLDEALAPVTSQVGFLNVGLHEATEALRGWRRELHSSSDVSCDTISGTLPEMVSWLEPLTGGGRPRELLIETRSPQWTAYLDCGVAGTDAVSAVGYLSERLARPGLFVVSVPHTMGTGLEVPGRYGAVGLTVVGPTGVPPLFYVREVSLMHGESRWEFRTEGEVQPYETPERYTARRVRDRFTSQMLAQYCAALGVHPFVEQFYGPTASLVRTPFVPPPAAKVLSLAETQHWRGIKPGQAESIPG